MVMHMPKRQCTLEKQIYAKADNVKLALLLLKTTPISNKTDHDAPANVFFGRQLKTNLPIQCQDQLNICTENTEQSAPEVLSKYHDNKLVWVKLDPHTKWMPGKIEQVSPNQSYIVILSDGPTFKRNEHHIAL